MKRRIYLNGLYTVLLLSLFLQAMAQSIPVGMPVLEDYYRRKQLLGELDSTVSFMIRPVFPALSFDLDNPFDPDSTLRDSTLLKYRGAFRSQNSKLSFQLLPLNWQQQYNSHHPYGWNDGLMIPAKGYQTLISGGFFAKAGPLEIQIRPEYVYAENADYQTLDIYQGAPDIPARFGQKSYSALSWGQSSIRLNFASLSLGLSNENLYWGPGSRNSLLMSNHAPGFKHLTFNTRKPIRSPVGSFEFQAIAAKLEGSGYSFLEDIPEYSDWRYLSAFALTYQPKWVPGLFLGLTRAFQSYRKDIKKLGDYIPFLVPYQKSNRSVFEEPFGRDQVTSVFTRWIFPKADAEVYFEYGINDNAYNLRDLIGSPEHSRTYLFGLTKMTELRNRQNEHIRANLEFTQISQSIDRLVREAGSWYYHGQIAHGYTHKGEVLGAGIGPGANLQSLDLSWVKGFKSLGLLFERYVQNDDYYVGVIGDLNGYSRRWVDMSAALQGTWNYKNLLLNAQLQFINSLNYQWKLQNYKPDGYYIPENDVFNFHGKVGVSYRF
ncbi:MAG: capsule assembly Wzi family protein [Daejeonella sp.]